MENNINAVRKSTNVWMVLFEKVMSCIFVFQLMDMTMWTGIVAVVHKNTFVRNIITKQ